VGTRDSAALVFGPGAGAHDRNQSAVSVGSTAEGGKSKQQQKSGREGPPASKVLITIAEHVFSMARTAAGEALAIPKKAPHLVRPLRGSGGFRQYLAMRFFEATGKVAPSSALTDAINVLEGRALWEGRLVPEPGLRVFRDGRQRIYVDHGTPECRCTIIGPDPDNDEEADHYICDMPMGVEFKRTELTGPMVRPEGYGTCGEAETLRALFGMSEESFWLLTGWMVAAFIPDIPHPILTFTGEQGTGKSTLARFIVQTIDPSPAPLRTAPKDVEQLVVTMSGSWVVAYDNISSIPPWLSDALCRAVTGDGMVRRKLYTDGDLAVTAYRRCVILTSIHPGALRGDLADRLLPIELERIPAHRRRLDAELEEKLDGKRPFLLGWLFALVAKVLCEIDNVKLDSMPRMADFAHVLAALDRVTAWQSLETYSEISSAVATRVIEGDLVAQAVVEYVDSNGECECTTTDLLHAITDPNRKYPRSWPTTPQAMAGALKRITPALEAVGIRVSTYRAGHRRTRMIVFERADDADDEDKDRPHSKCLNQNDNGRCGRCGRRSTPSILKEERGSVEEDRVGERPSATSATSTGLSTQQVACGRPAVDADESGPFESRERTGRNSARSGKIDDLPIDPKRWSAKWRYRLVELENLGYGRATAVEMVQRERRGDHVT